MIWRTTFGAVELLAQILRLGRRGRLICPLAVAEYSKRLQRALTDFGAEESFGRAVSRVREHYGIEVPASAVRRITLEHGKQIGANIEVGRHQRVKEMVTQMDGSMIPIVQPGRAADARKNKTLLWREARLCCAHSLGQTHRIYGATLGSVENASWLWRQTAERAGLGKETYVHGVGDGAGWIVDRFNENFRTQGAYLLDFFHVSEYLARAALAIAGEKKSKTWLHRQQERLLNNQLNGVLRNLQKHQEPIISAEAPVRSAYRYLDQRRDNLDYMQAQKHHRPIGSGEIESSHRHVVQQRLKLAGSWWKEQNAQTMLNLRVARANNDWDPYWTSN